MNDTAGRKPVVLMILDGWGAREGGEDNAPLVADTPNFDRISDTCPVARLKASGGAVGLPEGQIGNSEVGHTTIGAGRVIWMPLPSIDRAIEDGSFARNEALGRFVERMRETGGTAHVMGLASPGGVHAHQRHIAEAARVLSVAGVPVRLHLFTDGRDVPPQSAREQVAALLDATGGLDSVRVATVTGRFHAMDRDERWERTGAAWRVIVTGEGRDATDPIEAISAAYGRGETDEFIEPTRIDGYAGAEPERDGVFFLNFRGDRARQILSALVDPEFAGFDRGGRGTFAAALGIAEYSDRLDRFMGVMFPPKDVPNTLGEWVSQHGRRQFRVAETEKYPHVTFFLSGGVEEPCEGEDRHVAPSPRVRTYDMQPEMSAGEVTEALVGAIRDDYDLIVVNYANPDMVGHTGSLEAAVAACEAVDAGLGKALAALEGTGGAMIVTADHGNCEVMVDPETGGPHTAHTTNLVPVILVEDGERRHGLRDGGLADLAPTVLALMGLPQPEEMTGRSLLSDGPEGR